MAAAPPPPPPPYTHTHTRKHAASKESTQRPKATASRSWICLLQISRDNLAITVTERWEDDFGWACVVEEGGGRDVCVLRAHIWHLQAPLRCTERLHILIKVLFGLSWWHEPLIICNRVSLLTSNILVHLWCLVCRLSTLLPAGPSLFESLSLFNADYNFTYLFLFFCINGKEMTLVKNFFLKTFN